MSKRAIEESFPIVEINRLAVPERNAFKPIYDFRLRLKRASGEINFLADIHVPMAYPLRLGGENDLGAHHTKQDCVPLWEIFGRNPTHRDIIPGKIVGYHFAETLS